MEVYEVWIPLKHIRFYRIMTMIIYVSDLLSNFRENSVEGTETGGASQYEYAYIAILGYRLGLTLGQAKHDPRSRGQIEH